MLLIRQDLLPQDLLNHTEIVGLAIHNILELLLFFFKDHHGRCESSDGSIFISHLIWHHLLFCLIKGTVSDKIRVVQSSKESLRTTIGPEELILVLAPIEAPFSCGQGIISGLS